MSYNFITNDKELALWLQENEKSTWIGLDTEFISEGRFHSELCLVQVATAKGLVLIDAISVMDLRVFWERLCRPDTLVIMHACRSEMEFCFIATGKIPETVFDVQLAAGFVGCDYPSSFKALGEKLLKIDLPKEESRSDWHHRPLSVLQVEYALNDVLYLRGLADVILEKLSRNGRLEWFRADMRDYLETLRVSFQTEGWTKLPKLSRLSSREHGIVREVWLWRQREAERKNKPAGRILRDDLIVELARKKSARHERLSSVRGLYVSERELEGISQAVASALALDESALPVWENEKAVSQYPAISQFIMTVLTDFARQHQLAISLLASARDIRDFIADYYKKCPPGKVPRLKRGWRRVIVGDLLSDLLHGKVAVMLAGPELTLKLVPFDKKNENS